MAVTDHKPLAALVARVDRAQVTRQMVDSFRSEIAGYRRLPTQVLSRQIIDIARRNVELCFDSIAAGASPAADALEPFRASARERATEGMPLEDLLHAYRLGGRIGWRAIAAAATAGEQAVLVEVAELVMRYVDEVSAAVAQAYLDERQQLVSEEERSARDLFDALVAGGPLDARLERLAETRGFALDATLHPFVLRIPGSGGRRHADLAAALRRDGILALTEGDRVAGLLPAAHRHRVALPGEIVVIGEPADRGRLGEGLSDVRTVAELAERRGIHGPLATSSFALELLLLAAPRHARRLAEQALRPLLLDGTPRGSELLATVAAFVAHDLDRRCTAAHLHIHPNTLDYRLRRVRELTGLDLRRPEAIATVVLALRQRRLDAR